MPRFSHFLILCLALAALGLAIIVRRQSAEIDGLIRGQGQNSETPHVARSVRPASPRIALPPRHARPAPVWVGEDAETATQFSPAMAPLRQPGLARLLNDPGFLRALAVHQEGALDARFAPLFRRLGLSDDELAAFKRLLVEKDSAVLDVAAVTQEVPDPPLSPQTVQASIHAAQAEVENAIRQSLGQERYGIYADYLNTLPQRATVKRLEQRLSYTDVPLQPMQAETLVAILAQNPSPEAAVQPRTASGADSSDGLPISPANPSPAPVSQAAVAQANAVLSPPQVAALRQIQTELNATAQAAAYLSRTMPAGGSFGPDAAGRDISWLRFLLQ